MFELLQIIAFFLLVSVIDPHPLFICVCQHPNCFFNPKHLQHNHLSAEPLLFLHKWNLTRLCVMSILQLLGFTHTRCGMCVWDAQWHNRPPACWLLAKLLHLKTPAPASMMSAGSS